MPGRNSSSFTPRHIQGEVQQLALHQIAAVLPIPSGAVATGVILTLAMLILS